MSGGENTKSELWAQEVDKDGAALCGEQVQRGSRGCSAITQQDSEEGADWSLGPDKKGRSLDFCFCERSITALAWQWWVG